MFLTPCALLLACLGPGDTSILPGTSVAGPSVRVELLQPPPDDTPYFSRADNVIRLTGAMNETVAFQLVLSATAGRAAGIRLAAEDLVGPSGALPRGVVRMYRHWPITVERYPNWYLCSQGLWRRRDILDVLVPLDAPRGGQPFVIDTGNRLAIWVEIRIPPRAVPGTYKGAILLHDADGEKGRTPLEVVVRDILLSPKGAIPILARVQLAPIIAAHTPLDPQNLKLALADEDARRVLWRTFAILHDHGLSPYTDEVRPMFSRDDRGGVRLDWAAYDAFCGSLIDGRAYEDGRRADGWPLPTDKNQPDPARFGGMQSTVYAAVLINHLARVKAHFEGRGWLDRGFVWFDPAGGRGSVWAQAGSREAEPPSALRTPPLDVPARVRRLARAIHSVDEGMALVSTLIPHPMSAFGWIDHRFEDLAADVDIWATPARFQHGPTLKRLQTLGKRTWLLPDRPPFSGSIAVEAPPIQSRSLAWQAFLQGHDAIVLPHATDWPPQVLDDPIRERAQSSDTWLLYPGAPFGLKEPVPSVRLKQLQLGVQDYQYLRLLESHGGGETARLLAGSLIKATGTDAYGDNYQDPLYDRRIDDVGTWELARRILIEETAGALAEGPRPDADGPAMRLAWARFLGATRRIDVRPESARLIRDPRPGRSGYLVHYEVAIRSELRTPLRGGLTFGPLQRGMRSVSDRVRVGPIPEMGLVRKTLVLETALLPPKDIDGHRTQAIVFDAGTSGYVEAAATLSIVQVPPAPNPIAVDGNLSDWPPNEFNIVGDFRLINAQRGDRAPRRVRPGRTHPPGQGEPASVPIAMPGQTAGDVLPRARARAESQTVAYFCRDAGMLYIGIHAAVPAEARDEPTDRPLRNFVMYEDLMPVDEDLVEILIDPTNAATQSDDLYHIVLKATGNTVFERGVDTHPAIGRRRSWPGRPPRCCVAKTAYGWCAEVAIPIASFGPAASTNAIWGINLARLEPVRGEYSDWARAPRHCYDPRTLGNLVWPE